MSCATRPKLLPDCGAVKIYGKSRSVDQPTVQHSAKGLKRQKPFDGDPCKIYASSSGSSSSSTHKSQQFQHVKSYDSRKRSKREISPDPVQLKAYGKRSLEDTRARAGKRLKLASSCTSRTSSSRVTSQQQKQQGVKRQGRELDSTTLKPLKKQRCAPEDLSSLVGLGSESRLQHLQRHGGGRIDCPRCRYYMFGATWAWSYGSIQRQRSACRERIFWISERPARFGGSWSLGCSMCAALLDRLERDQSMCPIAKAKKRARLGTRWCRYEVKPKYLQASHIRQHAHYDLHKIAVDSFFKPDEPLRLILQRSAEDDSLLSGAVPQPEDWLRCWRSIRTPESWQASSAHNHTEHFIHQIRSRPVLQKALPSMALVMRECLREEKRQLIAACMSLTLALDDRGTRRLVLLKFDTNESHNGGKIVVIAAYQTDTATTLIELDDDASRRIADSIAGSVKAFCTPYQGTLDENLYNHICQHCRFFSADGCPALKRVYHFLKERHMPNLILRCRDPAHAVRIACKDPLHATGIFEAQHKRLFKSKHAVLKDVQFSSALREKFVASQREVLSASGVQGGEIDHVLRHVSFVEPRFESFTAPRRKYVCLINAFAICLAYVANDMRVPKEKREAAACALEAMTPQDIVACGLSADFSDECLHFLRLFDKHDHDPALIHGQVSTFIRDLKALFHDGFILCAPEESVPNLGLAKTLTQIAVEQCREAKEIFYGVKSMVLWSQVAEEDLKRLMFTMRGIVADVIDRLMAEFHPEELLMCFRCFSLAAWQDAFSTWRSDRAAGEVKVRDLLHAARGLCRAFAFRFSREPWMSAAAAALRLKASLECASDTCSEIDNRSVWYKLLDPAVRERECAGEDISSCTDCVPLYTSFLDGTPSVERGLGALSRIIDAHAGRLEKPGCGNGCAEACLELYLDGPQKESDLFIQGDHGILLLTDVSRRYLRCWVATHGRRFCCTQEVGRNREKSSSRLKGTEASVCIRRRAASKGLLKMAQRSTHLNTIFGQSRASLMRDVGNMHPASLPTNTKLENFRKISREKREAKESVDLWAGHEPVEKLRIGGAAAARGKLCAAEIALASSVISRARQRVRSRKQGGASSKPSSLGAISQVGASSETRPLSIKILHVTKDGEYLSIPHTRISAAARVLVPSLLDIAKCAPVLQLLQTWMVIITNGKEVKGYDSDEIVTFSAAPKVFSCQISFTERFVRRHPNLHNYMVKIVEGSKWKLESGPKSVQVDTLDDMRSFLVSSRRFKRQHTYKGRFYASEENLAVFI